MHKWITTIGIVCCGLLSTTVRADDIDSFLIFGDSYFDNGAGNRVAGELGVYPPPNPQPPYADGRHSNGLIWIDYLSEWLKTHNWDLAVAGAETGSGNNGNPPLGGLFQQVQRYQAATGGRIKDSQLTILDGGGNDFLAMLNDPATINPTTIAATLEQAIANLGVVLSELQSFGAEKIVIWNLGDFSKLPLFSDPALGPSFFGSVAVQQELAAAFTQAAIGFNQALSGLVSGINAGSDNHQQIFIFDAFSAFNELEAELTAQGIDITQHTLTTPTGLSYPYSYSVTGPQPDHIAFYDPVHPTSFLWERFTKFIASYVDTLIDGPRFIAAEQDLVFEGGRAFRDTLFNHFRLQHVQQYVCPFQRGECCGCAQLYTNGEAKWGNTRSRAGTLGFRYNTQVAGIGLDYFVDDCLLVGAAFDIQRSSAHVHHHHGHIQLNDYIPTVYASWSNPCFFFDAALSLHVLDFFKIRRNIPFVYEKAKGHTHGLGVEFDVQAGYVYQCGCFTAFPLVGVSYENIHINHYRERHAGVLNLSASKQRQDSCISRLGGQIYWNMSDSCFLPYAELIWDHEFLRNCKTIKPRFVHSIDNALDYNRPSITERDLLKFGVGFDVKVTSCVTGTFAYEGETTFRNYNNVVRAEIDCSF